MCRAARATLAFKNEINKNLYLLDFAGRPHTDAAVHDWQIAVWYPNNVQWLGEEWGGGGVFHLCIRVVKLHALPATPPHSVMMDWF